MAVDVSNMLSKNVILVDIQYIDSVTCDLTVDFEKMLNRQISKADLALWLDCVALDGGIKPGENAIQVIFIYSDEEVKNFATSKIHNEIDCKAFKDNLGEFTMEAYKTANDVATIGEQFVETLRVLVDAKSVDNVIIVPNMEMYGDDVKHILKDNKKQVTLLAIQPQTENGFIQQQLGFSVIHALGISGKDLKR